MTGVPNWTESNADKQKGSSRFSGMAATPAGFITATQSAP
jgi:hypothetical protein